MFTAEIWENDSPIWIESFSSKEEAEKQLCLIFQIIMKVLNRGNAELNDLIDHGKFSEAIDLISEIWDHPISVSE